MELSPMRFKSFVWPHNPRVYSITYEQHLSAVTVPGGGDYITNEGTAHRVMRGEGEFVGEGAYDKFRELASVFYDKTPGLLVHPVWQISKAYFAELTLEQEPRRNYVRYSFAFWEALYDHETTLSSLNAGAQANSVSGANEETARYHTVGKGDTLSAIARKYQISLEALVAKNPQIRNPNLIYPGDLVLVS